MNTWLVFWICLAGVFGVASLMTRSFHVFAFSLAALVSAGATYFEAGVPLQWGAYALLSVALLFAAERIPFARG